MSLTAHLLFNKPTRLPQGEVHTYCADRQRKWELTRGQQENNGRNLSIHQGNIERIYLAILDGSETMREIADATFLSVATVQKSVHELERWPGGARVSRVTGSKTAPHRFYPVSI